MGKAVVMREAAVVCDLAVLWEAVVSVSMERCYYGRCECDDIIGVVVGW